MTTVINLFGAPGTGKSTLAAGLFYHLKIKGLNVELASEYIKDKFYEEAPYPYKDQLYTFAKQNKKIRQLYDKVDYIVCDSPLLQGIVYENNEPEELKQTILAYFNRYNNLNILLKRQHAYHQEGRVQTEQEADLVGQQIQDTLDKYNIVYRIMPTTRALENILDIFHVLGKESK